MRDRFVIVVFVLAMCAIVSAQGPTPADPSTTPQQWYGSTAGIIAATAIGVSVLKRALANVKGLNSVPTWMYAVATSAVLTFLTVKVWGTLPGQLWQTMSQIAIAAGASSGFYEWLNNPATSLAASAVSAGVPVDPAKLPDRDAVGPTSAR